MNEQIHDYVVSKISSAASDDDIIYSICQEKGFNWEEASQLVEQVKEEHNDDIATRQAPIKMFLSIVFFILGIVLVIGPILYLWNMLDMLRVLSEFLNGRGGTQSAIKLLQSRCLLLNWFELPSWFSLIALGAAIFAANIQYIQEFWRQLLPGQD